MSGIAGFCNFKDDLLTHSSDEQVRLLIKMREALINRGGSQNGEWLSTHCGLTATGCYNACDTGECEACAAVFDGEIYNRAELWSALSPGSDRRGPADDANLVALGFSIYGVDFVKRLDGVFAFAIWQDNALYLFRDHAGVKPLFYTQTGGKFIFASEIKAILQCPDISARLDADGFAALLALGPAREEHSGVFKDIYALPPGEFMVVRAQLTRRLRYWDLAVKSHMDNEAETVAQVRALLLGAITRQTETRCEVCAFLSGGVDSSVVTAVAADIFKHAGKSLQTFSFDFKDSGSHFTANAFQPDRDRPWVDAMVDFCKTDHHYIECGPDELAAFLGDAVIARDLPGMADIDASLLYFCSRLPKGTIALTGECADEVFGGYPWFHRPELVRADGFPWSSDVEARKTLFSDDLLQVLRVEEAAASVSRRAFERAEAICCLPETETTAPDEKRLRILSYLTIKWFMTTLTDRMDRMGAYAGIAARVPFADKQLMEYVWNAPWAYKRENGVVKHLLREAARGLLPDEVLFRKKSPFPKTYDPVYVNLVGERVRADVLNDANAPIRDFIDAKKIRAFMDAPMNVSKPWFGQLMAGPQRLAWLWQFNFWLKQYHVTVEL